MNDEQKQKAIAAVKIGWGVTRCVSGGVLMVGHGIMAGLIRSRPAQCLYARDIIQAGQETFKEGLAEWKG